MHSSLIIAERILELAKAQGRTLTPMQLLKLVYICHGFSLGLFGRPLTLHNAEAWKFGPVIPELYHAIKQYKSSPVESVAPCAVERTEFDENDSKLIETVYNKYGKLTGVQLSRLTHTKGSPWSKTWTGNSGRDISNDLIEEHYREIILGEIEA